MSATPAAHGFRMPAEWLPHEATWVAWPSHEDLWLDTLPAVRDSFVGLCRAIAGRRVPSGYHGGIGGAPERLEVLVPDDGNELLAQTALAGLPCRFHRIPFGDIWLRDTAPVFVTGEGGEVAAACFEFNGWGDKYVLPHDDAVSARIADAVALRFFRMPWVLEGGAVEVDGDGTCLTTRQCLLNPNRNPELAPEDIEGRLREGLGVEKVLWLGDGLLNDHTDGHVDTIARFVGPGRVVAMEPNGSDDPNRDELVKVVEDLRSFTDAAGRPLEVVTIASPGLVTGDDGRVMPASYVNFYVANAAVVVPTYGVGADDDAVRRVAELFPGRETTGVNAKELLQGGGAFHCITQQQPRAMIGAGGRR